MNLKKVSERVLGCLKDAQRLWMYRGFPSPDTYHALLTSLQHSDGYADVGTFLKEHPEERREFAAYLLELVPLQFRFSFSFVGGAANSSTLLTADMAELSHTKHIRMIKEDKLQVWHPDNPKLEDGATILEAEELITKSVSAKAFRDGIRAAHPGMMLFFVPFLPTIVDRCDPDDPVEMVEDSRILSLLRLPIRNFDPDKCPYCKAGSKAIKPKEDDNWKLLTAS